MKLTPDRLHNIGWGGALAIAFALTLGLTFRVNAVKSEVRLADRQVAHLEQENMFLATEFETRANQQQLKELNEVDFGYEAPSAGQYLKGERDLAALGKPAAPDAPAPIRVATLGDGPGAADGDSANAPPLAMVSPMTGHFIAPAHAATPHHPRTVAQLRAGLSDRLSHVEGLVHAPVSRE